MSGDENKSWEERRSSPRVAARIGVRFGDSAQAARALNAYSVNVSTGGLCLLTRKEYDIGHPLKLSLSVEGYELELEGEVAWVRGGAVGVRFVNLTLAARVQLEELVKALPRTPTTRSK
jgi:uncharacterized protein (TIGR02266 family)